jgi:hypothetical protein
MQKEQLENYLKNGMSTRDIANLEDVNIKHRTISYYVSKYNLNNLSKFKKNDSFKFDKIDNKEKAYIIGFMLGDSYISEKKDVELKIALRDKEVIEYISNIVKSNFQTSNILDKKKRRFPFVKMSKRIEDITKFTGGNLKKDRHYPIVRNDLEKYLLLGFFDAEGCVTFGHRKDRNRLWQKVSFTSSFSILVGLQQFLLKKLNISTALRKKTNEDCYVLDICSKENVKTIIDYMYSDLVVLKRKFEKCNALRQELGEIGES